MTRASGLLGLDRVIDPGASNVFDAWRLDPEAPLRPDEIALEVDTLNLDATSFRDVWAESGRDAAGFVAELRRIIDARGKMHNPRTASGGVMSGTIAALGAERVGEAAPGERVVTLVSNTLVPLRVEAVVGLDRETHQVAVRGRAILPPYARFTRLPAELDERLALAVFDVCGVVPPARRLAAASARTAVVGAAGRAGLLATVAVAEASDSAAEVLALVQTAQQAAVIRSLGLPAVRPMVVDATRAAEVMAAVGDRLADVVIDCTNVAGTEVACAALCREGGHVHFFNMATSFQAATLGAEILGRPVSLAIGFGLFPEAPLEALALLRRHPSLEAALAAGFPARSFNSLPTERHPC